MNTPIFYIFLIIITVILYNYFFSEKAKIKRKLINASVKKISSFKNNETAKIIGNIEIIEEPLIAPLSNRKCAHYYIRIEHKVSSGKNSHWKTIIEEEVSQKFIIKGEDKSYAYLNENNIKSYIVQDEKFSSGFGNDATERLEKYLESKGYESEGIFGFNKTLRYYEGILENNEKIAVFGKGNWTKGSLLNLPNKFKDVLKITSQPKLKVYLSDDPETTFQELK
jgi:hypothetical protein